MVAHTISEMPDYIRDGRKVKSQSGNVGIYNRVTGVILEFSNYNKGSIVAYK